MKLEIFTRQIPSLKRFVLRQQFGVDAEEILHPPVSSATDPFVMSPRVA